jgi:D-glycero-beta-D-manno-heptose 1-phosphate adenylyltransferase
MKVVTWDELERRLAPLRAAGGRVVFTNGCFDLLHVGHVRYLQAARRLGDALVVGVNSDRSVRGLKGEDRPIVSQEERAEILAALACVDYVTIFEEPTPERLLASVRPDVHVKGGDYREEDLPEAPLVRSWGGEVVLLPLTQGRSTTGLARKLLGAD